MIGEEILLKEDGEFFKYYHLALIGVYEPLMREQKIVFKKDINISNEDKLKITKLIHEKVIPQIWQERSIFNIIGCIPWEGKRKEILAKTEGKMIKYYFLHLLGVYTPKIPGQTIIFRQDTLENMISAETKDTQQTNHISPLEKEQIQQFLEKMKVKDILEDWQSQKEEKKEKQEDVFKQVQKSKKPNNQLKDIHIKQEVDMDTRVTDMHNLEQVLQRNKKMPSLEYGDEPLTMGIVESGDVKKLQNEKGQKEQGHTSRYEAVIVTKKGRVQKLNLENDTQEGTNPSERNYQIKQNDSVKNGDVLTRLKVGEGTIGIEKGQYGEVEVYHSPRKTIGGKGIEGNKCLDRQLETSNAKNTLEGTDIETLKLAQEYHNGYRSVEEGYQEVKRHQEKYPDCEPKSVKDLDGEDRTKSHIHLPEEFVELSSGEKISYDILASRWGFYKEGKPDANYIKEKFAEKRQKDKKVEDIIQELDEEYEDPRTTQHKR